MRGQLKTKTHVVAAERLVGVALFSDSHATAALQAILLHILGKLVPVFP